MTLGADHGRGGRQRRAARLSGAWMTRFLPILLLFLAVLSGAGFGGVDNGRVRQALPVYILGGEPDVDDLQGFHHQWRAGSGLLLQVGNDFAQSSHSVMPSQLYVFGVPL